MGLKKLKPKYLEEDADAGADNGADTGVSVAPPVFRIADLKTPGCRFRIIKASILMRTKIKNRKIPIMQSDLAL